MENNNWAKEELTVIIINFKKLSEKRLALRVSYCHKRKFILEYVYTSRVWFALYLTREDILPRRRPGLKVFGSDIVWGKDQ